MVSKDKGVYGELFEIEEKDLLEHVTSRLKDLEGNGELKGIQDDKCVVGI